MIETDNNTIKSRNKTKVKSKTRNIKIQTEE
jgi:hypothetical protein